MSQKGISSLPQYRVLNVTALPSGATFRWEIRESDGTLVEISIEAYATAREAVNAGNRAARAMKRECATEDRMTFGIRSSHINRGRLFD